MPRLPLPPRGKPITLDLEGEPLPAIEGEPVACALVASGEHVFARSVKYHRPRGAFCMAAACSHCLMRVDGVPNVYTCRTPARAGMKLERQNAYPSVRVDIFSSIDWVFPRGLDHHAMFAGVPVAEGVMAKVARHLAGLGVLPDSPAPARPEATSERVRVAIVGSGAAGTAAAVELAARGVPHLVIERDLVPGGRLVRGPLLADEPQQPPPLPREALRLGTTVIGLFDDEGGRYLACVQGAPERPRLLKVYAERFLLAHGGHPTLVPFGNNDIPGVYAGRAAARLMRRHDVSPGARVALVGRGHELAGLHRLFTSAGVKLALVLDTGEPGEGPLPAEPSLPGAVVGRPVRANGRRHVTGLTYVRADGKQQRVACDAVVLAVPPVPTYEVARQGGAEVVFSPEHGAFVVKADAVGRTAARDVWVAGGQTGGLTARAAVEAGKRTAAALAEELS